MCLAGNKHDGSALHPTSAQGVQDNLDAQPESDAADNLLHNDDNLQEHAVRDIFQNL
jgi:hypothetical protein